MSPRKKKRSLATEIHDATEVLKDVEERSEEIVETQSLFHRFLGGVVSALGALAAAVIIIPIALALLRQVQWVPVLGDFISKIVMQVEHSRSPSTPGVGGR